LSVRQANLGQGVFVSSPGESRSFLLFEPVLHRGKMLFTGQQPLSAMMHGDLLHETS
jgi:hypothetical protein